MLYTLSAHCLLSKQPPPETDAIGHRSPFCDGASVKTNEGRWVTQRLNDSGSYRKVYSMSSSCSTPVIVVWLNFREPFSLPIGLSVFEGICLDMMTQWWQQFFWNICIQHLCWISHILLCRNPGLYSNCENSHKSANDGRTHQFQSGLARVEDLVQVRQATLQLVEGGSRLTRLSYGAQQLPWPQLWSCGWTSTLCQSGVHTCSPSPGVWKICKGYCTLSQHRRQISPERVS